MAAAFFVLGVFWGTWAVAAADAERFLGLSHRGFGLLLTIAVGAGAAGTAAAGPITDRAGTTAALAGILAVWGGAILVVATRHGVRTFEVAFIAAVALGGAVDVVMNVAATAELSTRPGALVRFHGFFNSGALSGAALTGLLVAAGRSWRLAWMITAGLTLGTAAWVTRIRLPARPPEPAASWLAGIRSLRSPWLIRLTLAFAFGAMTEGGIETWGVLFLRSSLAVGALAGAAAYVVGQSMATAARIGLGPSVGQRGALTGTRLGAGLAAAGLTVEAFSTAAFPAAIGLAAAAVGVSMCWPLMLSLASSEAERPALVIGAVTGAGYIGFLVGPSLVGVVAGRWGLRPGLLVLATAALLAAGLPAHRRRQPASSRMPLGIQDG